MFKRRRRVKTPVTLQMEVVECGAACLGAILAYFGCHVPLSRLRGDCGVNRGGSRAGNMIVAALRYGLEAKGFRRTAQEIFQHSPLPAVVFWKRKHFLVVEGCTGKKVWINDPAAGRYRVSDKEFLKHYSGIVLEFRPGRTFKKSGRQNTVPRALAHRMRGFFFPAALILAFSLLLTVPSLALPVFTKVFVDKVLIAGALDWALPLAGAMGGTMVFMGVFAWLRQRLILRLTTAMTIAGNARFMWQLLQLPIDFFFQRIAPEVTARCQLNERLAAILSGQLATGLLNLGMAGVYLGFMAYYDRHLALFGLAVVLINLAVARVIAVLCRDQTHRLVQDNGKGNAACMATLQIIDTVKSQGIEKEVFSIWAGFQAAAVNASQRLAIMSGLGETAPRILAGIYNALVLGVGALHITQGTMTLGELAAFQILANMMAGHVGELGNLGRMLQDAGIFMKRLDDVMNHRTDTATAGETDIHGKALPGFEQTLTGNLKLENITFGYSRSDPPLLENFSLTLEPGARVALVGRSGSGKSTAAKIAAGLFLPWSGRVLMDGTPLDRIAPIVRQNSVAVVDQDIFLFEGSLRDNITLWDELIPEADIIRACRDADIFDTLISRTGGLGGHLDENGANLSGGQRQSLEIARALARNPALLILDEATNAMDPAREHRIDMNIRQRGCAVLMVAHRLSAVRDADEIIVLNRGRVADRGTHGELMARDGLYCRLVASEAEGMMP